MQTSYFNRLSQIKPLLYNTLVFNVYNFQFKDLKNLIKYERILYEITEQKMLMNIFFDEKEIDYSDLRKYENLSLNLYYQVILCSSSLFILVLITVKTLPSVIPNSLDKKTQFSILKLIT